MKNKINPDIYIKQFKDSLIELIEWFESESGKRIGHIWLTAGNKDCVVDFIDEGQ